MASILRATPCASRPGPQRQRQGRTSSSGCSSRGPPSATVRTSNMDGRLTPRENISISVSLLLKIAARTWATQTEESPPSPWGWWPHIIRGRIHHRSGRAKRLLGYGCTAAARRSPSLATKASGRAGKRWDRRAGGSRPLAAGKMWEFLSLGGERSSPRLLPIPFFS